MKSHFMSVPFLLLAFFIASCQIHDKKNCCEYQIKKTGDKWELLKNGKEFYIKGAVAGTFFDKIKEYGGNSVRIWSTYEERVNKAHEHGLTVMVSLPVKPERNGMDWGDTLMVKKNMQEVMSIVQKLKDHPAVMVWGLGNELDWIPPGIPYNPKLWDWIEIMAQKVKEIDKKHPVITVIGNSDFDKKTKEIAEHCPGLDAVGINLYGDFTNEIEILRKNWNKPYFVTEWGPHGHWQRPYTEWKAPLEESSSEKAYSYKHNYTNVIQKDNTHCLGSYVFLWGQKQEITHTWYGMFSQDGLESESVNVMRKLWSEKELKNTAPRVKELFIVGKPRQVNLYLETGKQYTARLEASDAEDELTYYWEIKPEVEPAPYAGIGEEPAKPLKGLINNIKKSEITFQAPVEEGAYRLFAYAYDGQGHWGYANFPFYCK